MVSRRGHRSTRPMACFDDPAERSY